MRHRNEIEYVFFGTRVAVVRGSALVQKVGNYEVAVFNLGDSFVAYENTCPHQGGPVAEGTIEGATVTCPWHAWCFDLRTGSLTLGNFARLRRFGVYVDNDELFVSTEPLESER